MGDKGMIAGRLRRIGRTVVVFGLGVGLGLWLRSTPIVSAEEACLEHIRTITAPKVPLWQQ